MPEEIPDNPEEAPKLKFRTYKDDRGFTVTEPVGVGLPPPLSTEEHETRLSEEKPLPIVALFYSGFSGMERTSNQLVDSRNQQEIQDLNDEITTLIGQRPLQIRYIQPFATDNADEIYRRIQEMHLGNNISAIILDTIVKYHEWDVDPSSSRSFRLDPNYDGKFAKLSGKYGIPVYQLEKGKIEPIIPETPASQQQDKSRLKDLFKKFRKK